MSRYKLGNLKIKQINKTCKVRVIPVKEKALGAKKDLLNLASIENKILSLLSLVAFRTSKEFPRPNDFD